MKRVRRLVVFLPSLLIGLVGAVWLLIRPFPYTPTLALPRLWLVGLLLAAVLLAGARLLERTSPSFRHTSAQQGRILKQLRLSRLEVLALALLTSFAEELFFRGALLPLLGVWLQALLFGLLHPAGRRGLGYTLYTFVAGLLFGYVTLRTGSLWPSLSAHALVNFQGLWAVRKVGEKGGRVVGV